MAGQDDWKPLDLERIEIDPELQSRVGLNDAKVDEYAELMEDGHDFPPVTVFYDGRLYWLCDGFHRVEAFKKAGHATVPADIRKGTRQDAILFSVQANSRHGLQRTNADKRRAVELLLTIPEWREKSPRAVAKQCGVSHVFAGKVMDEVLTVYTSGKPQYRVGRDGKRYPVKQKRTIPPDVVEQFSGRAECIRKDSIDRVQALAEIGEHLKACKARIGKGFWGPWLEDQFGWSREIAEHYIRIHEELTKRESNGEDIAQWAFDLLARQFPYE